MIKHLFKSAIRNLKGNVKYSFLNWFGLLAGLVASIVLLQYVSFERSFDNYHADKDDIYRLRLDFVTNANTFSYSTIFQPVGPLLVEDYPQIEAQGQISYAFGGNIYEYDAESGTSIRSKEDNVYFANQEFWDLFSFELINGDENHLLTDPNSVIISQSLAERYFGSSDVIGRRITRNNEQQYQISGVFEDVPENSHLQFDMLLAQVVDSEDPYAWSSYDTYTYIKVDSESEIASLGESLKSFIGKYRQSANSKAELGLQQLEDIHFSLGTSEDFSVKADETNIDFLYHLAIGILIVCWINFINLISAVAVTRGHNVAIRNVLGVERMHIAIQFLMEAFIITTLAVVISLLMAFNFGSSLFGLLEIDFSTFSWGLEAWLPILIFFLASSLVGGLYPSAIFRRMNTALVVKGKGALTVSGNKFRKSLVVVQFTATLILLTVTFVVNRQISLMRNSDLGIAIEQNIVIESPSVRDSTIFQKLALFKDQVKNNPGVVEVAYAQDVPGRPVRFSFGGIRQLTEDEGKQYKVTNVEPDFAEFFDLEFVAGRNFRKTETDVGKVFINEAALSQLNFNSPEEAINQELTFPREHVRIIGVVKDFHIASVKEEIEPTIFHYRPEDWPFGLDHGLVRVSPNAISTTLEEIEAQYANLFPNDVFEFYFLDAHFDNQYTEDQAFMKLFGMLSTLGIVIAGIGLFTLTTFTLNRRKKELSIRRFLGSSVLHVIKLLAFDFLRLISLAILFAAIASFFFTNEWLNNFAVRITLQWWHFLIPGAVIAILTQSLIGWQTLSLVKSNLLKNLREE